MWLSRSKKSEEYWRGPSWKTSFFVQSVWDPSLIYCSGDSSSFKFNEIDEAYGIDENGEVVLEKVDRRSHVGIYQVIDGVPR